MKEKDKLEFKFWLPFLLGLCVAVGMMAGYKLDEEYITPTSLDQRSSTDAIPGRIDELLKFVDAKYVDKLDQGELSDKTISFILDQLDPFSSYISPSELKKYKEYISGQYHGIGLEFRYINDTLSIFRIIPNSPADKAGLEVGDKILSINGETVSGIRLQMHKTEDLIRNNDEENVQLTVLRHSNSVINKEVKKERISTSSISSYYMIDDSVGYIKLDRFTSKSYKDFMEAFEILVKDHKMDDLILDLRGNLGGVLIEAIKILQQFYAKDGQLILYTEGDNSSRIEYKSHGRPFFRLDKIAVLIDGKSASASEVVAGAIQDTDRGLILGESSYGKGLVQEHYKLRNGGELRLTVARYFTPTGRLIQKSYDSAANNEFSESLDSTYKSDGGRHLYAGGGITPDHLVYSPIQINQILDSLATQQLYEIVFSNLQTIDESTLNYNSLAHHVMEDLTSAINKENLKRVKANPEYILQYLRSTFAHIFEGSQKSIQEINMDDPMIEESLNYFRSPQEVVKYSEVLNHE